MKIAYCLTWDFSKADGVERKIFDQVSAWVKLGHEVEVYVVGSQTPYREWPAKVIPVNCSSKYGPFQRIREWSTLSSQVDAYSPDVVYFRNQTWYPPFSKLLKKYPVVAELNSMDVQNAEVLAQVNLKQRLRQPYFLATRGIVFRGVVGMVGVTSEMTACSQYQPFGKPMTSVGNSICLSDYDVLPSPGNRLPKLILVGTGGNRPASQHWQGVDKLAEFAKVVENELEFLVVGNGLADGVNFPSNVEVHGWQDLEGLRRLYAQSDVAFGTVADYRRGMGETSSLKSRQALAYGLPIIYGGSESMFAHHRGELPSWVLQLPNNESNLIDAKDVIVAFASEWSNKRVSHQQSAPYVDVEILEGRRLDFMMECARKNSKA